MSSKMEWCEHGLIGAECELCVLKRLLNRYTSLVNCGDCGSWDPETEDEVIAARAILENSPKEDHEVPEDD